MLPEWWKKKKRKKSQEQPDEDEKQSQIAEWLEQTGHCPDLKRQEAGGNRFGGDTAKTHFFFTKIVRCMGAARRHHK